MNLLYVTSYHLPNPYARAVQVFNTCSALAECGAQVTLLAKHKGLRRNREVEPGQWPLPNEEYFGVSSNFRLAQPPHSWLKSLSRRNADSRFATESLRYAQRSSQRSSRKWDAVYTRHAPVALSFAQQGIPVALEVHDLDLLRQPSMQELIRQFPVNAKGAFRGVVAISQTLAEGLDQAGVPLASTLVAHDGIDTARFAQPLTTTQARASLRQLAMGDDEVLCAGRPVVGYCGHFYKGRGIEMLLECARRRPRWTFLLIGGLEKDVAVYREIARTSALKNVIFTGYMPNVQLGSYLWACDVLTMPYEWSFGKMRFMSPMKMFEYMACGRAIVTADWPQIREVLHPGQNALFHERGNVDGLEASLEQLIDNASVRERLQEQALQDVRNYTWIQRARRIMEWLQGAKV